MGNARHRSILASFTTIDWAIHIFWPWLSRFSTATHATIITPSCLIVIAH